MSIASLVVMTTPLCDASMQKKIMKKRKKKKRKRKEKHEDKVRSKGLIISHVIIYWDNAG
jgi:hypothetical protein